MAKTNLTDSKNNTQNRVARQKPDLQRKADQSLRAQGVQSALDAHHGSKVKVQNTNQP